MAPQNVSRKSSISWEEEKVREVLKEVLLQKDISGSAFSFSVLTEIKIYIQGGAKVGLKLYVNIYSLLFFINYCIVFSCKQVKPTFATPCITE